MKNKVKILNGIYEGQILEGSRVYYDYLHTGNSPDLFAVKTPDGEMMMISDDIDVEDYESQLLQEQIERLGAKVGDFVKITHSGSGTSNKGFNENACHQITKITSSGYVQFDDGMAEMFQPEVEITKECDTKLSQEIVSQKNKIEEQYLLENKVYARINGKRVLFGCRCEDQFGNLVIFTKKQIKELKQQSKIYENGWLHLCNIIVVNINDNKIEKPIKQEYLEQLIDMGYDISQFQYQLLEESTKESSFIEQDLPEYE